MVSSAQHVSGDEASRDERTPTRLRRKVEHVHLHMMSRCFVSGMSFLTLLRCGEIRFLPAWRRICWCMWKMIFPTMIHRTLDGHSFLLCMLFLVKPGMSQGRSNLSSIEVLISVVYAILFSWFSQPCEIISDGSAISLFTGLLALVYYCASFKFWGAVVAQDMFDTGWKIRS